MDKEQMAKPPQDWEFRSKKTWQRLIIMVGGVTVNLLLGMAIYAMVLFVWGREYLPVKNATYGVVCDSILLKHGLQDGDKILKAGDAEPLTFSDLNKDILIRGQRTLLVSRNGVDVTIELPETVVEELLEANVKTLFSPQVPFFVDTVLPGTPADGSGLLKGDQIIAVNNVQTAYFHQFRAELVKLKNQEVEIAVMRDNTPTSVKMKVGDDGKVGIGNRAPDTYFSFAKESFGLLEAIPAGISHGASVLGGYVESMKLMFTAAGAKQMGGFGAIGNLFAPEWDWQNFWEMTALISIILAFMNILPIPALDGGHVMFLLYEMITGRKPNEKLMEYAQMAGMILLLALFVYANGNDLFKFLVK